MSREYYWEGLEPTGTQADHCYGRRIYIHRSQLHVSQVVTDTLNEASVWGGWDKNHNGWLGWELPLNRSEAQANYAWCRSVLEAYGYKQLDSRPWN
jgi:hypothetical protein